VIGGDPLPILMYCIIWNFYNFKSGLCPGLGFYSYSGFSLWLKFPCLLYELEATVISVTLGLGWKVLVHSKLQSISWFDSLVAEFLWSLVLSLFDYLLPQCLLEKTFHFMIVFFLASRSCLTIFSNKIYYKFYWWTYLVLFLYDYYVWFYNWNVLLSFQVRND